MNRVKMEKKEEKLGYVQIYLLEVCVASSFTFLIADDFFFFFFFVIIWISELSRECHVNTWRWEILDGNGPGSNVIGPCNMVVLIVITKPLLEFE